MATPNKSLIHLLLYPLIAVLLAACGAASAPVANQVTTTSVAQMAVTPTATSVPAATATAVATATPAPTVTSAPTDMPVQTAISTPTGTSAATTTSNAQPVAPGAPVKVPVAIKLFQFKPKVLEIKAGTTVIWTNQDNIEHSVTSGTPPKGSGAFDSDFFTQGETFTFTFSKPGTYTYFCRRHNSMTGTVNVSAP